MLKRLAAVGTAVLRLLFAAVVIIGLIMLVPVVAIATAFAWLGFTLLLATV